MTISFCACESTPSTPSEPSPAPLSWRWDNPFPLAHSLNSIHGVSAVDVFAVGEFGAVVHFDGSRWNVEDSGTDETLNDVWGDTPENVYAVGDGGTVRRFDGTRWRFVSNPAGSRKLNAVWGIGSSFLVIVGDNGLVLRWDGQTWAETTLGFPSFFHHYAVWGSATDTVYVVGEHAANATGSSYKYDGTTWVANPTMNPQSLFDLFGVSGSDVVAVGTNRTLLHFDGTTWSELTSGRGLEEIRGVWGPSSDNLWLVGRFAGGVDALFRWRSNTLTPYGAGLGLDLCGAWGSSETSVYAVGENGAVLTDQGTGWTLASGGSTRDLFAIHGVSENVLVAVGAMPEVLMRVGATWVGDDTGHVPGFVDVWALSAEDGFAVSTTGTVFRFDRSVWTEQIASGIRAVWAKSDTEAWAVGATVTKLSGSVWIPFSPAPLQPGPFNDVWGDGVGNIYVAGESGLLLHWNGATWSRLDSLTSMELRGIWGVGSDIVFAVGNSGTILRYDASGGALFTPTVSDLSGVWALSPQFAVAVGESGTIVSYDGSTWEVAPRLTGLNLQSVWGSSSDNVFAAGERGTVLRLSR